MIIIILLKVLIYLNSELKPPKNKTKWKLIFLNNQNNNKKFKYLFIYLFFMSLLIWTPYLLLPLFKHKKNEKQFYLIITTTQKKTQPEAFPLTRLLCFSFSPSSPSSSPPFSPFSFPPSSFSRLTSYASYPCPKVWPNYGRKGTFALSVFFNIVNNKKWFLHFLST